jgi:chemotaxis protein MotA
MDFLTIGGLVVAALAILGGQVLEGGHISSIVQPTAAIIVLGGTLGSVLVSYPLADMIGAIKGLKHAFLEPKEKPGELIELLLGLAKKARKDGLIALESDAEKATDPFLKKALSLAVDGTDPKVVMETLESEISAEEEVGHRHAKVFETAGGFAPTIGILGAVLGLIHVMENLSEPSKLGSGIATAFVATVYGVGSANILFLPLGNKLKLKHGQHTIWKMLIVTGVLAIQGGENTRLIEEKLRALIPGKAHGAGHDAKAAEPAKSGA